MHSLYYFPGIKIDPPNKSVNTHPLHNCGFFLFGTRILRNQIEVTLLQMNCPTRMSTLAPGEKDIAAVVAVVFIIQPALSYINQNTQNPSIGLANTYGNQNTWKVNSLECGKFTFQTITYQTK